MLKVTIFSNSAKRCRGSAITFNIGAKQVPSLHFENMIEQCKPTEIRFWLRVLVQDILNQCLMPTALSYDEGCGCAIQ